MYLSFFNHGIKERTRTMIRQLFKSVSAFVVALVLLAIAGISTAQPVAADENKVASGWENFKTDVDCRRGQHVIYFVTPRTTKNVGPSTIYYPRVYEKKCGPIGTRPIIFETMKTRPAFWTPTDAVDFLDILEAKNIAGVIPAHLFSDHAGNDKSQN
jgi:hypothetical protein